MTITEARDEFRTIRDAAAAEVGRGAWMAAVTGLAFELAGGEVPAPAQWVEAARAAEVECPKCHGGGIYHWGGTVNGKPIHSGTCFRCGGTGRQGAGDFFRNLAHTRHTIAAGAGS